MLRTHPLSRSVARSAPLAFAVFAAPAALALSAAVALGACSSSDSSTSSSGGSSSSGGTDAAADSADASTVDAAPEVVNECKNFSDRSAASAVRILTWDFVISTSQDRCVIIAKGQDVTFNGDFNTHPLTASGGDTPNPIASPDANGKVTFPTAGTYGFLCGVHPSMTGAIRVVE